MFLLDRIISSDDRIENIIKILKARGYLIDEKYGKYYLSDNAAILDVELLNVGMKKFELGHLTFADWNFGDKIEPFTIEIQISEAATIQNAIDFFEDVGGMSEALFTNCNWKYFVRRIHGHKIATYYLEPYVAYYVKAVSACGVVTCSSCDGNHNRKGPIYIAVSYPFTIWHEYIWRYIVCRKFGKLPCIGEKIDFYNLQSQKHVYQQVYEIADYLYRNRIIIRDIKKQTVNKFTNRYLRKLGHKDTEKIYRQECERVFADESTYAKLK